MSIRFPVLVLFVALSFYGGKQTSAGVVGTDDFSDGNRTSSPNGLNWYYTLSSDQSLSVVDDAGGIGSGNALRVNITDDFSGIVGQFGQTINLANIGDDLRLSFDVRFTGISDVADTFRWGLYSSQSSPLSGDNNPGGAANNDRGYYAALGTGAAPSPSSELFRENGGISPFIGGEDRTSLGTTSFAINDTNPHAVEMYLVRTATDISITVSVDASNVFTGVLDGLGSAQTSFDEIGLGIGGSPQVYLVDNILVESNTVPIPEPSTFLLLSIAGAGGWWMRRKRALPGSNQTN